MVRPYRPFLLTALCQAVCALPVMARPDSGGDDYVFDTRMFRGAAISQTLLTRLNQRQNVMPGAYRLDVWVNQRLVDRLDVVFQEREDGRAAPCLTRSQFRRLGILPPQADAQSQKNMPAEHPAQPAQEAQASQVTQAVTDCLDVVEHVPGAQVDVRMGALRLDLRVPQALLRRAPRGYVNPADLDAGATVGFINYMGNHYHVWQPARKAQGSSYVSLQGGLNLGLWQWRHQSSVNWMQGARRRWKSVRTYVQRPLPEIGSHITLGQAHTRGRFFSGVQYFGAGLATDERVRPDSQRGYAPVVRGVANGNARVSIRQNGNEIYQTTVPPGPFVISDLYPTSDSGDLEVEVREADGRVVRYVLPFAAVPESLREGQSHVEAAVGRTHEAGENSLFGDVVYQRGLSNAVTWYAGLRLAEGYRAALVGGVYTSQLGALGADLTGSHARLSARYAAKDIARGWMLRLSYSSTIAATGTTVTLANYHHSSTGYQDLASVLGARRARFPARQSRGWQRNRFDVRVNQQAGALGHVFLSGSLQDYHDDRPRDVQYQLGYGTAWKNGVSVHMVLLRRHVLRAGASSRGGRRETTMTVSLSIPLGANLPSFSTTTGLGAGASTQLQGAFSGTLDDAQTLHYSLGGSVGRQARQAHWVGNLQKRFSIFTLGVGASQSRAARQMSANVQGALAVHAGGLTLGPYVSDTFALVEAKGATGAKLMNSQTRIDANGYALLPALTPYRYNQVMLDPDGMSTAAELVDGEQRVAPYAGAVAKVTFAIRRGQALLIRAIQRDGVPVPFGAEVLDETGAAVGMVGQGGHIYVRTANQAGHLTVRWGTSAADQCVASYQIPARAVQHPPLLRLESMCGDIRYAGGAGSSAGGSGKPVRRTIRTSSNRG